MTEVVNIIYFLFIFLLFSNFGFLQIKNRGEIKLNIFDINQLTFYFLITLNFIFLSSIFNFEKKIFFYFLLTFSLFSILNFIIKNKNKFIVNTNKPLILLFLIIFLLLSFQISHDLFFSHDVRLYWFEKVLLFYNDMFVSDDQTAKPEYPHFGTYLWSFFWINSPLDIEYFGRLSYLFIYLISIFYIFEKINFRSVFIKFYLILIVLFLTFQVKYFDGRQDILIFAFNLLIFGYLYEIINCKSKDKKNFVSLYLLINLIIWTKTDGLLYILVYGVIFAIFLKGKSKYFSISFLIIILFFKLFFYYYYNLSTNPSKQMFDENTLNLLLNIDFFYRTYEIFFWFFLNIIRNPLLLLSMLVFVFIFYSNKKTFVQFSYLYLIFVLLVLGIYLTFLPTKYDFPFAMIGSFDRIIQQFSGIFLIPTLKFFENKKII